MASLECLDSCVADVEGIVIWKFVLVIVSLLLVGHLRVVLSCKQTMGISTCRLIVLPSILYSIDGNTINRHVEIPTVYLQLKTTRKFATNNNDTMTNNNFQITIPSTSATQQSKHSNDAIPSSGIHSTMTTHSSTNNEIRSTTEQPNRRSQRIQERSNTAKL